MRTLILAIIAALALAAPAQAQLVITPAPVPACTVGQTVVYDGSTWVCQPVAATPLSDSVDLFKNATDATKLLRFSLAGITTGTTRTVTWPDANLDFSGTAANRVLATGAAGVGPLSVRSLVASDVPALDASKVTTGSFANARTTATDANTASAIVARDASGNFSAGTITATLNGNAATATSAANADAVTNGVYTSGSYSDPTWLTISKSKVGLGNVENTALSTWAGTASVTTLGTVTTGTWSATAIDWTKVDKTGSALGDLDDVTVTTPTLGQVLKWSGTEWENADPIAVGGHALLSAAHTDTSVESAVRGGLIVGDPTPKWMALAPGANGSFLKSDGTDIGWTTISTAALTDASNVALKDAANTFTADQTINKVGSVTTTLTLSGYAGTNLSTAAGISFFNERAESNLVMADIRALRGLDDYKASELSFRTASPSTGDLIERLNIDENGLVSMANHVEVRKAKGELRARNGAAGTGYARLASYADNEAVMSANAYLTTAWNLDNTAASGSLLVLNSGGMSVWSMSSGTNPRTPDNVFRVSSTGQLYERTRDTAIGEWVSVTYASGNFTAGGSMTWTVESGDVNDYSYMEVGKTQFLNVHITGSTTGGTAYSITRVAVPNGRTVARSFRTSGRLYTGATGWIPAHIEATAGDTTIRIYRSDTANYPLETNAIHVAFECFYAFQ